jgi:putative endonuclease
VARLPSQTGTAAARRRLLGLRGEEAAARWYEAAGYDVVARNWRCPAGEIDLVAIGRNDAVVVFCEVKTRTSTAFGTPEEAVTLSKQRRLRRLAARWLAEQRPRPTAVRSVRFDVAAVTGDRSHALVVEIVHDAF